MNTFDANTLRNAYAEVERIRSLWYKAEETDPPPNYENDKRWRRYVEARRSIEAASCALLDALDYLREDKP